VRKTEALPASGKKIGTHAGSFHADEALACWLLRQIPSYAGAAVVRSRDPAVLARCDIVLDVGGVYDHAALRYDHHQRGFFETVDGEPGAAEATGTWKTKLSSSGLIYKHYGREIISRLADTSETDTDAIWAELYNQLMEEIDAVDNGIDICDGRKRYKTCSDLSSRVHRLNPLWTQPMVHEDQCKRFEAASAMCGAEFLGVLGNLVEGWLPARDHIKAAWERRHEVHGSGEVMKLPSGGLPWKEHLYLLEREACLEHLVKFVLFVDATGLWRVQAVTVEGKHFENRVSLLEPWQGLRESALSEVAGIPDCSFVHASGFIGGNKTYEGALSMALRSLRLTAA